MALLLLTGCATVGPSARPEPSMPVPAPVTHEGLASWYGGWHQGKPTASGETFDMRRLTAAHRTLPFGTRLRVTNLENGRSVVVLVTDRGPFRRNRIIDLSREAAGTLGMIHGGTARVRLEVVADP